MQQNNQLKKCFKVSKHEKQVYGMVGLDVKLVKVYTFKICLFNSNLDCHQPPLRWITNDCLDTAFSVLHRRCRHEAKYGIYWI
jgi:ABC-type Mn2+/Zn2+ transport system ATPase subunit